jgi:hypothetical protein
LSIAKPSNQWLTLRRAKSICAGVTRTSAPRSQRGTSPLTGSASTRTSSVWSAKPSV